MMSGIKSGKKGKGNTAQTEARVCRKAKRWEIPGQELNSRLMWLEGRKRPGLYSDPSGEAGEEHENNMKYLGRI